jgi:hypothetical protein
VRSCSLEIRSSVAALPDGSVLVAGDQRHLGVVDPVTDDVRTFSGSLAVSALFATATTLTDGRVLIAGGYDDEIRVLADVSVYEP